MKKIKKLVKIKNFKKKYISIKIKLIIRLIWINFKKFKILDQYILKH